MTPQLIYSLKKVGIMIVLAILGILTGEATGLVEAAGLDPAIWGGIIAATLTSAVRIVEGWRDGLRAEKGLVQPEDVTPVPLALRSSTGGRR